MEKQKGKTTSRFRLRPAIELVRNFVQSLIHDEEDIQQRRPSDRHCSAFSVLRSLQIHSVQYSLFEPHHPKEIRLFSERFVTIGLCKNYYSFVDIDRKVDLDNVRKLFEDKNIDITNIVNYSNSIDGRELDGMLVEWRDWRRRRRTGLTRMEEMFLISTD